MALAWLIQLPILFFSIIVHEVSHGLVALRNGDETARKAGRLTFNPVPHIDLFGTIVLPVLCYASHLPMLGWAKPVPVNPAQLRRPRWSLLRVALIGPASNIALSLAAAFLFRATAWLPAAAAGYQVTLRQALLFAVSINLFLAFFNLIPVHPLDGSKVLGMLLPQRVRRRYDRHRPYGFMIIVLLLSFGLLHMLVLRPSAAALELYRRMGLIW